MTLLFNASLNRIWFTHLNYDLNILYFRKYFAAKHISELISGKLMHGSRAVVGITDGHSIQHTRLPSNSYGALFSSSRGELLEVC